MAVRVARSVTLREGQPSAQLGGFTNVGISVFQADRVSTVLLPCASETASARMRLVLISTLSPNDPVDYSVPGSTPIALQIHRSGQSDVHAWSSSEFDSLGASWIESGRRVVVSEQGGVESKELEAVIAGLRTVESAEWDQLASNVAKSAKLSTSSDASRWTLLRTTQSGAELRTLVEGGVVCTTWDTGRYSLSSDGCRRPTVTPSFGGITIDDHGIHASAVASLSVTKAVLTMPNGTAKVAAWNLIGKPSMARVFVYDRTPTEPTPVSISFYDARGRVVWRQT